MVIYVANSADATLSIIAVPSNPNAIAFTPDSSYAYVTNQGSNTVSVFDTSDHSTVASIPVGNTPIDIAITSDGLYAYVCNHDSNNVSIIEISSNTVVATPSVGTSPTSIAVSQNYAYTANSGSSNISLIDLSNQTFTQNIAVPNGPSLVKNGIQSGNEDIHFVCVLSPTSSIATVFVDAEKKGSVATGPNPNSLVINEPSGVLAVTTNANNTFSSLTINIADSIFETASTSTDNNPTDSVFWFDSDASNRYVLITNKDSNNVTEHSLDNENIHTQYINTQESPQRIAIAKGSTLADDRGYVTNSGSYTADIGGDSLTVLDPNTGEVVENLSLEKTPVAIKVAPNNLFAYVANTGNNTICVLEGTPSISHITHTIGAFAQAPVTIPSNPSHVSVSLDGCIAVAYHASNTVSYGLSDDLCSNIVYGLNLPSALIFSSNSEHLLNTSASLKKVQGPWCTETYAKIEWGFIDNIVLQHLYRNGLLIATLDANQTTYDDHDLEPTEKYLYTLEVVTASGVTEEYSFEPIEP